MSLGLIVLLLCGVAITSMIELVITSSLTNISVAESIELDIENQYKS